MKDRIKGKSLIDFPDSYVVVDVETTGFDPDYDEIIELAAIKVTDRIQEENFCSLVHPEAQIPALITAKTGITNEMTADAPRIEDILPEFINFIGQGVIVGHNIGFDINFLYDNSERLGLGPVTNEQVNTMRLANRLLPELENRKLDALAAALGVEPKDRHRALGDCQTTAECFERMRALANERGGIPELRRTWWNHDKADARTIVPENTEFDPDSPVFGKTFVFTGELKAFTRAKAMQKVFNAGGQAANGVTRATNYLVVGNTDYLASINGGRTGKLKKAEELALKGQDIEIISENTFLEFLRSDVE